MKDEIKGYKVRLYPNKAQEAELFTLLSGCRFVWNYFLEKSLAHYAEHGKTLRYATMSRELTQLRKVAPELVGLHLQPLGQALRRLNTAYLRFFRKIAHLPRFKNDWDNKQSFQKARDWRIVGRKIRVQLSLELKTRGRLPSAKAKLGTLIIKFEAGKWFAVILTKEEIKTAKRPSMPIGIDVGLKHLAVTSEGKRYDSLKPDYALHGRMKLLKQKLARQVIGSKRREQTRLQMARLYQKIANQRANHLHQSTHRILERNPSLIAIESLNVLGMRKNHKLARSLSDVALAELHRQLRYKQIWRGGKVVEIDRFYPSTKTCSGCGYINESMTLSTRNWTCPSCGIEHDRDVNASRNILRQGMVRAETSRGVVEAQTIAR